mmetsp:Transcript_14543/g.20632  ORF Transcript_14543/g.20632 Transcript_14543/m.20632 type:complete len:221 (-) Transcript_14543:169-831(-)|eukprot:CAMPEP_0201692620 /NCGR_PEP_ID=MMETSP0578-20130828/5453_1 /ASSEMBLY_ACC=CAM_ASM_000663 /TAXON_ID=267565 /ORGANISM="Skeletonema grethea, Strain CCMP 1804" /LENGTH=220 /DNA_ID=CAMNT_0048178027 /DNA_START=111 /DNA_END=773 /DNA_ORIENTATION=+
MKIQSSLLILAAMAGSATAANKRKRVFKIYSREEIQAAEQVTRSLQKDQGGGKDKDKDKKESVPVAMSMSMPIPVQPAMCAFCDGKTIDPSLDLGVQGQTCGSVLAAASRLDASDANCALAKQAEFLCCPYVPPATTSATTTPMAMSMPVATAPAMSMPVVEETDAPVYGTEETETVVEEDVVEAEKELPPPETPELVSGAMTMETTLAALTVAGAMMLV